MAHKTTSFKDVKGVPLRDAKKPFTVTMSAQSIKNGRKGRPDACAFALEIWACAKDVGKQLGEGGKLFAVAVRKSSTHLGFLKRGGKLAALRFVHSNGGYYRIHGFDHGSERTFRLNDKVTGYVPTGMNKLGGRIICPPKPTSGVPGGKHRPCERRIIGDPLIIG